MFGAHTIVRWQFLLVHHDTLAIFLCRSFLLTNYWFSHLRVLGRHRTIVPNLKGIFLSLCALTDSIGGVQLLVAEFIQHSKQG